MKIENEAVVVGAVTSDNVPTLCRGGDNASNTSETKPRSGDDRLLSESSQSSAGLEAGTADKATLPRNARLPINRCNLPAVVLGGLTYQKYPSPLLIDGVAELHGDLFRRLAVALPEARADEMACGLKALSMKGSRASSAGMPRRSISSTTW